MAFDNTRKKLQEFTEQTASDLKQTIKDQHYDTGALYNSIEGELKENTESFTISLDANEYIKYLDRGKFVGKFLNQKQNEVENFIRDAIIKDITNDIKNEFKK